MKLEILERGQDALRDGSQQVSHPSTQGYVPLALKEVSLNTAASHDTRNGKSVTFLDQSLKSQVEEKSVISAMTQAGQPVTNRKYLLSPLWISPAL